MLKLRRGLSIEALHRYQLWRTLGQSFHQGTLDIDCSAQWMCTNVYTLYPQINWWLYKVILIFNTMKYIPVFVLDLWMFLIQVIILWCGHDDWIILWYGHDDWIILWYGHDDWVIYDTVMMIGLFYDMVKMIGLFYFMMIGSFVGPRQRLGLWHSGYNKHQQAALCFSSVWEQPWILTKRCYSGGGGVATTPSTFTQP